MTTVKFIAASAFGAAAKSQQQQQRKTPIDRDMKAHLEAMLRLLRTCDQLTLAARLQPIVEPAPPGHTRYIVIARAVGHQVRQLQSALRKLLISQDNIESAILGIDHQASSGASIGLVLPIYASTVIRLDGDGGIIVETGAHSNLSSWHLFKPVSVQAMWFDLS